VNVQNICGFVETEAEEEAVKRQKETSAQSLWRTHGQRFDCSSGVLGMHVEANELQRSGTRQACCSAGLSPHSLSIWHSRLEQRGNEMDWRSLLHWSTRAQLDSAANRDSDLADGRREPGARA
jgi:hypothetical protein